LHVPLCLYVYSAALSFADSPSSGPHARNRSGPMDRLVMQTAGL
jgi:hypothetical protein